jgi:glycogen operon protein
VRAENPVFRQRHFFEGRPAVPGGRKDVAWFAETGQELTEDQWWQPDRRTLGMFLAGDAIRSRHRDGSRVVGDSFLLWLNAADADVRVTLPEHGQWAEGYEVLLDTGRRDRVGTRRPAGGHVTLQGRSAVLLRAIDGVR